MILAFILSLLAGLSTGIGGLIAFVKKANSKAFLASSLGFSAGVMIYVSMIELLPQGKRLLLKQVGNHQGEIIVTSAFFIGMLIIMIIDKLIPEQTNPHEIKSLDNQNSKLMRVGLMSAIAIAIHNFPEGMATFISAMQDSKVAIPIVIAIAIHNIPEGIAVAVPIYQASGSKNKAFIYALLSGLAEPIGAIIGWLVLMPFMNNVTFGILYGIIAGIMVFIAFDELIPAAKAYGKHHNYIYGIVLGMLIMAISLLIF